MERIVHKSMDHDSAREWDITQHVSMSPQGRMRVAKELKVRAYPSNARDVRECHRTK